MTDKTDDTEVDPEAAEEFPESSDNADAAKLVENDPALQLGTQDDEPRE